MKKLILISLLFLSCKKQDLSFDGIYLHKEQSDHGKEVSIITFSDANNYIVEWYRFSGETESGKPVAYKTPDEKGTVNGAKLRYTGQSLDWAKVKRVSGDKFDIYLIFDKKTVTYNKVTKDQCLAELMLK